MKFFYLFDNYEILMVGGYMGVLFKWKFWGCWVELDFVRFVRYLGIIIYVYVRFIDLNDGYVFKFGDSEGYFVDFEVYIVLC